MPAFDPMFERALLAAIALALSLPFGLLLARMLGIRLAGRALHRHSTRLFARLNRAERQPYTLAMRGACVMTVFIMLAWASGSILTHIIYPVGRHGSLLGIALLVALINAGGILYPLWQMARHGARHNWPALDGYLNMLAPASHGADGHGKLRLGIRLAAGHIQHRILGSLIAFIIGDFDALFAYRALHLCATHAPSSSPNWHAFGLIIGWAFAPFRAVTHGVFVVMGTVAGAAIAGCKPLAALRGARRMPTYLAGLLHISLGGTESRYGKTFREAWVGSGTAKLEAIHGRRASYWAALTILISGLCMASLSILHS